MYGVFSFFTGKGFHGLGFENAGVSADGRDESSDLFAMNRKGVKEVA